MIQVASLRGGPPLALAGPGIRDTQVLCASGLPGDMAGRLAANRALFPRGVDFILERQRDRIARAGELEAAVALPETYAKEAGSGEARLFLWSNPNKIYRANLRELSPSADPATRNFAARFSILDADAAISLGMSATLTIASTNAAPTISVPLSALFNQGAGAALWRVGADGRLDPTPVTVLRYEANAAIVSGPLKEGDNIVILGVHKLDAGQRVRVVTQQGS